MEATDAPETNARVGRGRENEEVIDVAMSAETPEVVMIAMVEDVVSVIGKFSDLSFWPEIRLEL